MEDVIRHALRAAGLPVSGFESELVTSPSVNLTYVLRFSDGGRYVLRVYRWPFDGPDDLDRPTKEVWLAELLKQHGVPTPRVLAKVETAAGVAVLRDFVPGVPLGALPEIHDEAWRVVGASLARVHAIRVGDGTAGVISGRRVVPFSEGSWGRWQLANAVGHSREVAGRGDYPVDPDVVRDVYSRAVHLLDERPVQLLHNDPHAWNVLVDHDTHGWRCMSWLDWEFAWAGDPAWDLARLDIFRLEDIGPTPTAFYEGYGAPPVPVVSTLYEFAIMLWMSNQAAAGDRTLWPTYERAHRYLQRAPAILADLRLSLG